MKNDLFSGNCALCKAAISREDQEKTGGKSSIISVATMINDRQFWYGLSGVHQFKQCFGLTKDDKICNKCLDKHAKNNDIEESKTVLCPFCQELYQATFHDEESPQGWGCSANAYIGKDGSLRVSGGWGSKYDCVVCDVVVPVIKPKQLVCDNCIDQFIEEGSFVVNKDLSGI